MILIFVYIVLVIIIIQNNVGTTNNSTNIETFTSQNVKLVKRNSHNAQVSILP